MYNRIDKPNKNDYKPLDIYDDYEPKPWIHSEKCKCCRGTGLQTRNDGIRIECPCCGGTGHKRTSDRVIVTFKPNYRCGIR